MAAPQSPRWNEVTALYGGRFDPPHLGHVVAAQGLFKNPGVRRVIVLPSGNPKHSPARASAKDRLEMTRLAFHLPGHAPIEISDAEIARAERTGEPTYTFETLQELKPRYGEELAFVLGSDQWEHIESWHRFPEVLGLSHWILLARRPGGMERPLSVLQKLKARGAIAQNDATGGWTPAQTRVQIVETAAPEISSTLIRECLEKDQPLPESGILPAVRQYWQLQHLYGT